MDKKELNDLIDRIVLTGPGGTDLIKKVLKKLVNGSNDGEGGSGGDDGSGSASSLSDMTDVDISSPSDGDTLVYNATTHKWESGPGGGCSCLSPMIVEGTVDIIDGDMVFTPNVGMPSFAEARAHMINGGQVYMIVDTGVEIFVNVAVATADLYIQGYDYTWLNPDPEGGDDDSEGGDEGGGLAT